MKTLLVFTIFAVLTLSESSNETTDGELSRKILGSSVVTSVSVIMDNGNGSKTIYTDAVGKPLGKPTNAAELASPINLLNPDRYEFYTFDDNGDLVKRLMSLDEIKGIIATGDSDGLDFDSFTSQGYFPEKRVNEVVNTVQNVLKEEMETHKNTIDTNLTLDTPDVSDSWSMILPAVFGNSGEDIKPEKQMTHVTPDTIMIEPNSPEMTILTSQKIPVTNLSPKDPLYEVTSTTTSEFLTTKYAVSPFVIQGTHQNTLPLSSSTKPSVFSTNIYPSAIVNDLIMPSSSKTPISSSMSLPSSSSMPLPSSTLANIQNTPGTITSQISNNQEAQTEGTMHNGYTETTTSRDLEQFSTWIPSLSNNNEISTTNIEGLTTFFTISDERDKSTENEDNVRMKITSTTEKSSNEDLKTQSTEYAGYKGNDQNIYKETIPLEQAMSEAEKISASALLDQLLLTTNVYEINTELSGNTLNKLTTDQRFDMSTERLSGKETEIPTTEKNLINLSEHGIENNFIQNIDTLLSQAVNNVEELLGNVNNTSNIQNILNESLNKTMAQNQKEAATLASNLVFENFSEQSYQTTSPLDFQETSNSKKVEITTPTISPYDDNKQTLSYNSLNIDNIWRTESILLEEIERTTQVSSNKNDLEQPQIISNIKNEENSTEKESSMPFKTNTQKIENSPPLINITIITTDNMKHKTKPSPVGSSSEISHYKSEQVDKPETEGESTEIYIESAYDVSKPIKNPVPLPTTTQMIDETTNTPYEEFTSTRSYTEKAQDHTTIPNSDEITTANLHNKSTTIIIIKKNERPSQQDFTTSAPEITEQTTIISTVSDSFSVVFSPEETTSNKESSIIDIFSLFSSNENQNSSMNSISNENEFSNKSNNITHIDDSLTFALETNISTEKLTAIPEEESSKPINKNQELKNSENNSEKDDSPKNKNFQNKTDVETNHEQLESTWTLVPTIAPYANPVVQNISSPLPSFPDIIEPASSIDLGPIPMQGFGLEESTATLDNDIYQFTQLCNELAFGYWKTVTNGISDARSVFISPFGITSLLAMVFLGARGATSGEMNEILKLDDMVTFNPHLIFKSVSESIKGEDGSGVATSAIIRELFSDRSKGKLLPFYKERARAFYDGFVEEVGFREISDIIRRRTNLQVKKFTSGKVVEFWKESFMKLRPPLAGISVNLFQTDCSQASTNGREGELHFVVLPSIRQRRLVPIPAMVYKSGFLAGYEPSLDATAVSFGTKDKTVSTILVMPGQQGMTAPGDGLARLEKRLVESSFKKGAWSRLLRTLIPRPNVEVQIPRFSHRSFINATSALKKMGLHDLFDADKADLRGLNGVPNELFLSDIIQVNSFATCGEKSISESHHSEIYPSDGSSSRNSRNLQRYEGDVQKVFHDPLHDPTDFDLPLPLRPRQARIPEVPRLKYDRPFLYYVRHNPTGLILHMGRFNPRLLP